VLDFGGGLALPTVTENGAGRSRLRAAEYVRTIVARVERHFRRAGRTRPRIALEPGRALTGSAQQLLTRVVSSRGASGGGGPYLMLDAGTNLAGAMRFESHRVRSVNRRGRAARRYTLVGPLCSPSDVLCEGVALPALTPGDSLAILDAGAYFVPYQTNFSFPRPAIVMVERGRARLLRRAERFGDLVAFDSDS
jgi:diaminopimelate decarboxylase